MELMLLVPACWLFFAIACTVLAKIKNFDGRFWFYKGLLFGGFAFLFLLISPEQQA